MADECPDLPVAESIWRLFLNPRKEPVRSTLALKALLPEAEIHWGDEGTKHIDAMETCAQKLRGKYKASFQARLRVIRGEHGWADFVKSSRRVIFDPKLTSSHRDEDGDALGAVVESASAFVKQTIDLTKLS